MFFEFAYGILADFLKVDFNFEKEKVENIYEELGKKYEKDYHSFTYNKINKDKYSLGDISDDINIKVHLRDLQLYRD